MDLMAQFMFNFSQIIENDIESKTLIEEILDLERNNFEFDDIHEYKGEDKYKDFLAYFTSVMLPISLYLILLVPSRAFEYLSSYFIRKKTDVKEIINSFFRKDSKTRETPVFPRVTKRHVVLFIIFVLMVVWTFNLHMTPLSKLTEIEREKLSSAMENFLTKDYRNAMDPIKLSLAYTTSMIEKHRVLDCSIVYCLTAIICFFKLENRTWDCHTFFKILVLFVFCYLIVLFYISFFVESMRVLVHKKSIFLEENLLQNMPEIMTYLWLE